MPSQPTSTDDQSPEPNDQRLKTIQDGNDFIAKKLLGLEDKIDALSVLGADIEKKLGNYHADVMMIAEEIMRRKKPGSPLSPRSDEDTKGEE